MIDIQSPANNQVSGLNYSSRRQRPRKTPHWFRPVWAAQKDSHIELLNRFRLLTFQTIWRQFPATRVCARRERENGSNYNPSAPSSLRKLMQVKAGYCSLLQGTFRKKIMPSSAPSCLAPLRSKPKTHLIFHYSTLP
jgi:hypothetical protein